MKRINLNSIMPTEIVEVCKLDNERKDNYAVLQIEKESEENLFSLAVKYIDKTSNSIIDSEFEFNVLLTEYNVKDLINKARNLFAINEYTLVENFN